jgi:hypothetical protein
VPKCRCAAKHTLNFERYTMYAGSRFRNKGEWGSSEGRQHWIQTSAYRCKSSSIRSIGLVRSIEA